jgi:hypothetical protein
MNILGFELLFFLPLIFPNFSDFASLLQKVQFSLSEGCTFLAIFCAGFAETTPTI